MPKRKTISSISGLVDSDSDELGDANPIASHEEPPAKKARGRPKSSGAKIDEQSSTTRRRVSSSTVNPKQDVTAKRPSTRGRPRTTTIDEEPAEENEEDGILDTRHAPSNADHEQSNAPQSAPAKRARGRKAGSTAKQVTEDGDFEYTPTGSRQLKPTGVLLESAIRQNGNEALEQVDDPVIPESQIPTSETNNAILTGATISAVVSPRKSLTNGQAVSISAQPERGRKRPTVTFADTEKSSSEPDLRRKLGDMTKKYEALEAKYRTLREIGIVEANANSEKIRKQCENVTAASNKLIASLKEELAAQIALGKESRNLQKQLRDGEKVKSKLQSENDELSAQLSTAQTDLKALQTKLAAARNNIASAKNLTVEAPGSAVKSAHRAGGLSAEAVQVAQLAQLKEDLYADLTGLIIRGVKQREADHLYDCIQTGVNGTLQFKLAVAHEGGIKTTASLDTAEFHYMPLLDANRDAGLMGLLPEYLTVDITFSRQNASKFYTRVMDTLTKRRIDPEE